MHATRGKLSLLLAVSLIIPFLLPAADALSIRDNQKEITLTIEQGASYSFPLVIRDIDKTDALEVAGETANWVTFGPDREKEYDIYPSDSTTVDVNINIPGDTALREYTGDIRTGEASVVTLRIKVTLQLQDAVTYSRLTSVDREVTNLQGTVGTLSTSLDSMRSQLQTLQNDVNSKMQEIYAYQKDLEALETSRNALQAENDQLRTELTTAGDSITSLEQENTDLNSVTGMLVGTQMPASFFGGILLGLFSTALALRRESLKKMLRQTTTQRSATQRNEPAPRQSERVKLRFRVE